MRAPLYLRPGLLKRSSENFQLSRKTRSGIGLVESIRQVHAACSFPLGRNIQPGRRPGGYWAKGEFGKPVQRYPRPRRTSPQCPSTLAHCSAITTPATCCCRAAPERFTW